MEINVNLKRRRDSGEGTAKKYAPNNPRQVPPLNTKTTNCSTSTSTPLSPPQILQPTQPPHQMFTLSPQQEQCLKKYHRPYQIPLPRSQSADRSQPLDLTRTPSLPSLSPTIISSQELFPAKRKQDPPASKKKSKSAGGRKRTDNHANTAGSGFVLSRAGSSR